MFDSINRRHARQTRQLLKAMYEAQKRAARKHQPDGPGLCFLCLGDGDDLLNTGKDCPRCKGTGIDPDPLAEVYDRLSRVESRVNGWDRAAAILAVAPDRPRLTLVPELK